MKVCFEIVNKLISFCEKRSGRTITEMKHHLHFSADPETVEAAIQFMISSKAITQLPRRIVGGRAQTSEWIKNPRLNNLPLPRAS